jgi:riboflavin synthase
MFTGIVEETGTVEKIVSRKNLSVLRVRADKVLKGTKPGASIAVDGVCLTVTGVRGRCLTFDIMRETLRATTLGNLKARRRVNLERALKSSGRISGHFVTGHVDAVGTVRRRTEGENHTELHVGIPRGLSRYIVPKGSVCLDGISLTAGTVSKTSFCVYLIPFTQDVTTLGDKAKGDKVNIETDILAKYVLNK